MHRDIKCGNILLTEGGEVKLGETYFSSFFLQRFSTLYHFSFKHLPPEKLILVSRRSYQRLFQNEIPLLALHSGWLQK